MSCPSADHSSSPLLTVYTRHNARCPKRTDKYWKRCNCTKWIYVNLGGVDRRLSAKTRSWVKAEKVRHELQHALDPAKAELLQLKQEQTPKRVALFDAVKTYLADVATRGLAARTQGEIRHTLKKQFLAWAQHNGLVY